MICWDVPSTMDEHPTVDPAAKIKSSIFFIEIFPGLMNHNEFGLTGKAM